MNQALNRSGAGARLLAHAGAMGQAIGAADWATTPLGALETWPDALWTALGICLRHPAPSALWWGFPGVLLYNAAWAARFCPPDRPGAALGSAGTAALLDTPGVRPAVELAFETADSPTLHLESTEDLVPAGRWQLVPCGGAQGPVLGVLWLPGESLRGGVEGAAQSELDQLRGQLAIRDELFAVATHDLKSPLTALRLQLDTLERTLRKARGNTLPAERLLAKVESASRQAERLQSLVERTLDAARLHTGKIALEREPVELGALVRDVVGRLAPLLEQAGSSVTVEAPAPVEGLWDRRRLDQVVQNLVSNAAKLGRGRPIRVDVIGEPPMARLKVHDHGSGVLPEERSAILAHFQGGGRSAPTGLGLGLYVAFGIVRSMGGSIAVEAGPGDGSTFVVELPLD